METPDKIYIPNKIDVVSAAILQAQNATDDIEYIRKDALLEWAKEQASITEKLNGRGAMLKAWDTLIDKIESL